jgi:hypothetical protein
VLAHSRLWVLRARAALDAGDLGPAGRLFHSDFEPANIREAEVSLTDLWFEWQEKRLAAAEGRAVDDDLRRRVRREFPPPARFDFRMGDDPD